MDRAKIANAFPELTVAAEGPVLDTSCAALMRLAEEVHSQGYKVALTGEGADEALAGYVWYKSQKVRDWVGNHGGGPFEWLGPLGRSLANIGGGKKGQAPIFAIGGVRTAQQDMYELLAPVAADAVYSGRDVGQPRRPQPL